MLLQTIPVLPSADIDRDVAWYQTHVGFEVAYADKMYAVLMREGLYLHLQWHADTAEDPLLGGSVVRILVKDIRPVFEEFLQMGTVAQDALRLNTPWQTHEFGFYDLNRNAIFMVEYIQ
jgi:hypothetical protein